MGHRGLGVGLGMLAVVPVARYVIQLSPSRVPTGLAEVFSAVLMMLDWVGLALVALAAHRWLQKRTSRAPR